MKKHLLSILIITAVIWLVPSLVPPAQAVDIEEGDLIRAIGDFDVWIVKYMGAKKFRRLILNPDVFNMYGHLRWGDIKDIDKSIVDSFTESTLVRAEGDSKVYKLYPAGDTGEKRWIKTAEIFLAWSFDWNAVYTINNFDRDSYVTGDPLESSPVYTVSIGGIAKTKLLQLTPWTDGAVSMNMPLGWNVYTGGQCATKSILARDPYVRLKQVFYFSEAGPVYASQERKQTDRQNYEAVGGYKLPWLDSPLVEPLTAENFLNNFGALASMPFFQQAFPQVPIMTNVEIVNKEEIANKPAYATDGKLIRAEFKQNGKLGEGYFYIITVKDIIDLGYGIIFIGITAPKGLLDLITPSLKKSLESYTISQGYVADCIQAQNKAVAGALKAGRILSESSDIIMDVWENKLESEQRMSAEYSDAILGSSRLYNPDTDEVYEVTPEFYDRYQVHSDEFEMNYLEELPNDKWDYAPLNGAEHIK